MKTQLLLDLADPRHMSIHFCEPAEVEETLPGLREQDIAVMEIDGASLTSREDAFKAFGGWPSFDLSGAGAEKGCPSFRGFRKLGTTNPGAMG